MLNFSRGLQQELADTGIKVQVVLPAATATELWDTAGMPLSAFPEEAVMTTEHLVDAALAGFDQGELVTWPSWLTPDTGTDTTLTGPNSSRRRKPASPRYV